MEYLNLGKNVTIIAWPYKNSSIRLEQAEEQKEREVRHINNL